MNIAIVAGGKLQKRFFKKIRSADKIIGVDRGALWLVANKILPDVAFGDFDSVTKKDLKIIKQKVKKVIKYPQKKDATDLELAVDYAISLKPKKVVIFGGIGTRLDHTIAAVHLLEKFLKKGIAGNVIDGKNKMTLVKDSHAVSRSPHHYVSILPFTPSIVISLSGFAYPLTRKRLIRGTSRGISNVVIEKSAIIEVHEGIALVIKSRD
ncbi:thiamine diphosphokinase [Candidatus Gottesmanbacteria bacterium RIFCSPLOWO2_01_FULL_43_11b]|uniref:Thiamine diphosphokinase n=1 Tax=Candidatus Gottesmanbacteria bacterium RIFCSPLOWO2_01_FULL_43_11b TaxID=1798392 RepID=A0A1F6AHC1_9BACT|nr:MAG: thiamine diphosphokinase [Candidatus Gottesmanbacteria bacterium RIFCSPLOWO2_01_FULL_43_11b]